jgi:hypothetical protein
LLQIELATIVQDHACGSGCYHFCDGRQIIKCQSPHCP